MELLSESRAQRPQNKSGQHRICSKCGDSFSKQSIKKHVKLPHYYCHQCETYIVGRSSKSHSNTCGKGYRCSQCGQLFKSSERRDHHEKLRHITCTDCERSYLTAHDLHHRRNCHGKHSSPATSSSTLVAAYVKSELAAIREAREVIGRCLAFSPPRSRGRVDPSVYLAILDASVASEPIDAASYKEAGWMGKKNVFVICSMAEARDILHEGSPRLPILVPFGTNPGSLQFLDLWEYCSILKCRGPVHVHDFGLEVGRARNPSSMTAATAISRLRDPDSPPINMLDLSIHKENSCPPCLAGLEDYNLLTTNLRHNGREHETARRGKREQVNEAAAHKLAASARFHLLASKGALHLPHIDRGVITTIFVEHGQKLWTLWPALGEDGLEALCISNPSEYPPGAINIHLQKGDLLIQPRGTLHAPFSLETVLMTGTMHYDSREITPTLRQTLFELNHDYITNEPLAPGFIDKFEQILQLWRNHEGPWHWGTEEELSKATSILKEIKASAPRATSGRRPGARAGLGEQSG